MKLKAFSQEWANLYKEKINSNDEFKKLASSWNDSIILETNEGKKTIGVFVELQNGNCVKAIVADKYEYEKAIYIINAKVEDWFSMINGEKDPVTALTQKKLILVKGSLTNLLKYVSAAKELLKTANRIETYF